MYLFNSTAVVAVAGIVIYNLSQTDQAPVAGHKLHGKFTENAPPEIGGNLDHNLFPDTCYSYDVYSLQQVWQADIYLDPHSTIAITLLGITNPDYSSIAYCHPLDICTHMMTGGIVLYVNYSQYLNCPIAISYGNNNEDRQLTLNLLEHYKGPKCTKEQDDEATKDCPHSCRCITQNNVPIKKCTLPWMEGVNCGVRKSYEHLQNQNAITNDCPAGIQKMLNNDPTKYCRTYYITPAIPTEELRRTSYRPSTPLTPKLLPSTRNDTVLDVLGHHYGILGIVMFVVVAVVVSGYYNKHRIYLYLRSYRAVFNDEGVFH